MATKRPQCNPRTKNPIPSPTPPPLDAERSACRIRGPLHDIPFLIKDNIPSKDRMETTAGSWALLGSIVPRDAFVVSKLRQAGALLMGKATLSEWADMRSRNYSEGYSARGGQARSPCNLTVNPGGSSSGSAGAVAGNLVMFTLGTETDGSGRFGSVKFSERGKWADFVVINPVERNALVGIKPTVGLTSRSGYTLFLAFFASFNSDSYVGGTPHCSCTRLVIICASLLNKSSTFRAGFERKA